LALIGTDRPLSDEPAVPDSVGKAQPPTRLCWVLGHESGGGGRAASPRTDQGSGTAILGPSIYHYGAGLQVPCDFLRAGSAQEGSDHGVSPKKNSLGRATGSGRISPVGRAFEPDAPAVSAWKGRPTDRGADDPAQGSSRARGGRGTRRLRGVRTRAGCGTPGPPGPGASAANGRRGCRPGPPCGPRPSSASAPGPRVEAARNGPVPDSPIQSARQAGYRHSRPDLM
jgi:hypothetical protein